MIFTPHSRVVDKNKAHRSFRFRFARILEFGERENHRSIQHCQKHTFGDVSNFATIKSTVTLWRTHMPALSTSVRALHARARVALPKRTGRNMNVVRAFFGGASKPNAAANKSAFDFTVKDIDGQSVSLSKYAGKVCLVVNVASK